MKVLHVLNASVPIVAGYTSRAKYIVNSQKEIGFHPSVLTSPRQGRTGIDKEVIEGTNYFRADLPKGIALRGQGIGIFKLIVELVVFYIRVKAAIRMVTPDLIHAHSPILWALPAFISARCRKIPFVYEIRALWEDAAVDSGATKERSARYLLTKIIETWLVKRAEHVVVICEGLKSEMLGRGINSEKITIIRNGVDSEVFRPMEKDRGLAEVLKLNRGVVVGYIGSLYKFEGVQRLVECLIKICAADKEVSGLIVGSGETEGDIRGMIEKFKMQERIIMVRQVPHREVKSYYSLMDILVYPRESKRLTELVTPLKPLEAMAMGKTVLASDVGGLSELVSNGRNGILFRKSDLKDLLEKLSFLISNAVFRDEIGRNARDSVRLSRDWRTICEGYRTVYEKAQCRKG